MAEYPERDMVFAKPWIKVLNTVTDKWEEWGDISRIVQMNNKPYLKMREGWYVSIGWDFKENSEHVNRMLYASAEDLKRQSMIYVYYGFKSYKNQLILYTQMRGASVKSRLRKLSGSYVKVKWQGLDQGGSVDFREQVLALSINNSLTVLSLAGPAGMAASIVTQHAYWSVDYTNKINAKIIKTLIGNKQDKCEWINIVVYAHQSVRDPNGKVRTDDYGDLMIEYRPKKRVEGNVVMDADLASWYINKHINDKEPGAKVLTSERFSEVEHVFSSIEIGDTIHSSVVATMLMSGRIGSTGYSGSKGSDLSAEIEIKKLWEDIKVGKIQWK